MNLDIISKRIVSSMRKATKELYDSAADLPRGLQSVAGKYLGDGAIEVMMAPNITWVVDDDKVAVMLFKGRLLGIFEYGGAGLRKITGINDSVLLNYLNETGRVDL